MTTATENMVGANPLTDNANALGTKFLQCPELAAPLPKFGPGRAGISRRSGVGWAMCPGAIHESIGRPPWHLDIGGQEPLSPLPTLRIFTFLEPVGAHGGGTLYVAGSHHHALTCERFHGAPVRSAQVRDWLKQHPWFARLLATPTEGLRSLIGVEAQVGAHLVALGEMTGQPGDLIIMHPALLHAPNHNACDWPRMMLTDSIHRREEPNLSF